MEAGVGEVVHGGTAYGADGRNQLKGQRCSNRRVLSLYKPSVRDNRARIVGPLTTSNAFILTCKGAADDVQSRALKGDLAGTFTFTPKLKGDPAPIDVSTSEAVTVAVVGLPPPPAR